MGNPQNNGSSLHEESASQPPSVDGKGKSGWLGVVLKKPALLLALLFFVVIPLAILFLYQMRTSVIFAHWTGTLTLQAAYLATTTAISEKPLSAYFIVLSIGIAVMLAEQEILIIIGQRSRKVANWTGKVHEKSKKNKAISRWGMYSLLLLVWIPGIGLYGAALVAWLFRWDRKRALILLLIGWVVMCTVIFLLTGGILYVTGIRTF